MIRACMLLLAVPALLAGQEIDTPIRCAPNRCGAVPAVVRSDRDVTVTLDGRVLRYEVTEKWTNHGRTLGEADYVLPLPRGAAFEDLALEIDGEMVTGEALGAGQARQIYEEIVRRQRDPALVEWMGLGVLRTRIFPIQPGETRTVVVRFRAVAEREGDALRINVPAPRGIGATSGTDLTIRWPASDEFGEAWSPTHHLDAANGARTTRSARVADANGNVTLLVPVRNSRGAAISVLTHAPTTNEGYALITLAPPTRTTNALPRDVTFVLDISGSMRGGKMDQAKAAGRQLLNSLARDDRFRLIAFSGDVSEFRDGWTRATPEDRRVAERWLESLEANGGTNIDGALARALEPATVDGRLGLVLFMTDGQPTVGERRAERIAQRASELRGARRVFTFGLGADVNAGLLEQLALDGAGTAHFVRPEEDVERVVGVVAQRITQPVATDLRLRAEGVELFAVQPAGRIDLFAGQELTILARYRGDATHARVTITGDTPTGRVSWTAQAAFPERRTADAFVGRLWATQRVGWLSAERRKGGPNAEVDSEIRQLGERWGIPTELTSYLVLEPGMVAGQQPVSPMPRERRLDANGANGVSSTAMPAPSAFESARTAAAQRSARSEADMDKALDVTRVQRRGDRTFVLRDSTWTDSRAATPNARTVRIQAYSAAYFALLDRVSGLRELVSVGDRVEVHGQRVTLVLGSDGAATLSARELDAIVRDW